MQHNFPYNIRANNEFCKGYSNNNFDQKLGLLPKFTITVARTHCEIRIVWPQFTKYYAYLSSPWSCIIILVRVTGNYPRPNIILLHTYNLGSTIFAWSILSWILHRKSLFDDIDFIFQVWYKNLHIFGVGYILLASPHILKPHCYFFPIWILGPLRIHKQCISQTQTPTFAHQHLNGVFSSTYS